MTGHFLGEHAPGVRKPWNYWKIMHHQLLGHGLGMERIRSICPEARVGITTSQLPVHPHTDRDKDHKAAAVANEFMNFITLDPLLKGHYPRDLSRRLRLFAPKFGADDMTKISAPVDFIGVNNYQREFARHSWLMPFLNAWIVGGGEVAERDYVKDGVQHTSMGWEVYPEAIYEALKWLQNDYGNPTVMITENGAAFEDTVVNGEVDDPKRIAYLNDYMSQVKRAIDEGANITGYFVWTLLALYAWIAREPERGASEAGHRQGVDQGALRLADLKLVFHNRTNILQFLQGIPGSVPWGVLPFWIITFFREERGFAAALATASDYQLMVNLAVSCWLLCVAFFAGVTFTVNDDRQKMLETLRRQEKAFAA